MPSSKLSELRKTAEYVSRTVVEILSFKDIWVTTLTFWGHTTSSITWPLHSQYRVSYRWSIETDHLSRTVFEILSFKDIGSRLWTLGSPDVIGHVITGFSMCGFLLEVNMNWPCISHGCRDIELQLYLGHDVDLLGSRDVINNVTVLFAI